MNPVLGLWLSMIWGLAPQAQAPTAVASAHPNAAAYETSAGRLAVTPLRHASVLFQFAGLAVYVDPCDLPAAQALPRADVILITHMHPDHFDESTLRVLAQPSTTFVVPKGRRGAIGRRTPHAEVIPLGNGQARDVAGIGVRAVAACNMVGRDPNGMPYHMRGADNGYVLDFAGFRVYLAGDTEKVEEMTELGAIDIAFLPILPPYCMDEAACLDALKVIKPRVFYPYHYVNPSNGARADIARVVKDAVAAGFVVQAPRIY